MNAQDRAKHKAVNVEQGLGNTMHSESLVGWSVLQVDGGAVALTERRRGELRAKLRAGQLDELIFRAAVYREGANANFVRFRPEELDALAASFVGVPFLRNHDVPDIGSRDGTVMASVMVGREMQQTVRLTTERGMKDFLEGVIDRFSIGWYFDRVECSLCGDEWMACEHWPGQRVDGEINGEGAVCELIFVGPRGKETSAVNAPAVQGTRVIEQLCRLKVAALEAGTLDSEIVYGRTEVGRAKERGMAGQMTGQMKGEGAIVLPDGTLRHVNRVAANEASQQAQSLNQQIEARHKEEMIAASGLSEAGRDAVRMAVGGQDITFTQGMIEAQRRAEASVAESGLVRGIRPMASPGVASQMTTPQERVQSALNWIFGARDEAMPSPSMRSIRDLYQAITGDHNWYGVFNPEWAQLANANTTTLAGMVVNAFNRVVQMHYENMATYRWYENIVDVVAHDGSTHDVQMIMVDGLANLPTVAEGAPYTEATVGDSKESMAFNKKGHYVGITLETIRRSDIQRIQAIPRAMVQGAIRTRSAAIASIFTVNTATGPTLAQDSTVLFHANHGNTATTAFDATAWEAARTRIWEQTIPGTSKPLGLWPKFVLVPIELYDDALTAFGYGTGDVGKPGASFGQSVNPYGESRLGDPRPVPVPVPDWTDATNWAYIVDPRLHPVIQMAYASEPQGGRHALPEIFEVTSETSGLMFSNDTLPVKIRDWWSYGVSTYVGIGNNIVAG